MTRILVADDDLDVRAALRVALEVEGYEVEAGELLDKLRDCVLAHSAAAEPA